MRIRTKIRYGLARLLLKASALTIVPPWVSDSVLKPSFSSLTKEAYQKNAAFLACVQAHAFGFAEAPFKVYADESDEAEEIPAHPLRKLLRRPNPLMGEAELMMYTVIYAAIGGNAYWHIERDRAQRPKYLWPFHAGQIRPIPGGKTWISHYVYDRGDGQEVEIPIADVVHFRWPTIDPTQPWMAMPPLLAAARAVDADNEAARYLFALLANDAMPRTVLRVKSLLDPQTKRRMREEWQDLYGGDNLGKVAILEDDAGVERLSLNLQELAFEALHRLPETRICAALRVPPIIAGLLSGLERSTYANYAEARLSFTIDTRVPLWKLWAAEVENSLGQAYGGDVNVRPDLSKVQALQEDENNRWKRATDALRAGGITLNQYQKLLFGKELGKEGDVFLWGLTTTPVPISDISSFRVIEAEAARPALSDGDSDDEPSQEQEQEQEEQEEQPDQPKVLPMLNETKARRAATRVGRALQRIRREVSGRMEPAIDAYFEDLAAQVVARARKSWQPGVETKDDLPAADDLLTDADADAFGEIVGRYYVEVIAASWSTWNAALGVEIGFDLTDDAVVEALRGAGARITQINATTRQAIEELLRYGAEQGWTIEQLVRGDGERPGLESIIKETYKGRAWTIARTELGWAQQTAGTRRYANAGVKKVLVLDNGQDDPDSACQQVNGTTQTLDWARKNPLEHPNCTRAFAPAFD